MGQLNPFRFIETYGDVFRFVDEMLLLREEPTDMREYEADAALLASLVGIVFEVHGLFANPINDENEEHCFEFLGRLFTIDHDLLALDLIMKQLREGVDYSKARHCWVRSLRARPAPNCLPVVEWHLFRTFPDKEQWESYRRCQSLVRVLCGEGRERFCARLVTDRIEREFERIGMGC